MRRLNSCLNPCVKTILGITRSRFQQWQSCITSQQLSGQLGLYWSIVDFILKQWSRWLGYLGRMDSKRLPKQLLFGEVMKKRPFYDTKKRWRDELMRGLKAIGMEDWYAICLDKERWSSLCAVAVDEVAQCRQENTCTVKKATQEKNFFLYLWKKFQMTGRSYQTLSFL